MNGMGDLDVFQTGVSRYERSHPSRSPTKNPSLLLQGGFLLEGDLATFAEGTEDNGTSVQIEAEACDHLEVAKRTDNHYVVQASGIFTHNFPFPTL